MPAEIYIGNYTQSMAVKLTSYSLPTTLKLVKFKDTLTLKEIHEYVPFDKTASDDTIGLKGKASAEEEINYFIDDMNLKNNDENKVNDYYYFYLKRGDNIIGKANLRVSINNNVDFSFIYLIEKERKQGLGENLFAEILKHLNSVYQLNQIKCQILPVNTASINLVTKFGLIKQL
jgi:RimJ/RimL family protein N-acetyltransferase